MKKLIQIGFILIISISLIGCEYSKKEKKNKEHEEIKVNSNENVIKEQTVEVFEFKNTSLIYKNGNSKFETTITNTGTEIEFLSEFKIHIKNKNGEVIDLIGFFGDSLKPGEIRTINSYYGGDLSEFVEVNYEIIR